MILPPHIKPQTTWFVWIKVRVSHIKNDIKYSAWRDNIQRLYDRIKASRQANLVYKAKGTCSMEQVDVLPRHGNGNVSVLVKAKSTEIVDILRYGAEFKGVKCQIAKPRTLAEMRLKRVVIRAIQLSGDARNVAGVSLRGVMPKSS